MIKDFPECVECGSEFSPRRQELGYRTCLECGDVKAQKAIAHKRKCSAPLFNKGGYQYVGSREAARWAGRQMDYLGVKILLVLAFFSTLLTAACWANDKIDEYWGEDEDDE